LGESQVLKKFQRLLDQCEEEHVLRGTIIEFDTLDYVPKERHLKGMIVSSKAVNHRVDFSLGAAKYIEDASALKIGDEIIIMRKVHPHGPNNILPVVIIVPEKKLVLLSRERESYRSEGWAENAIIVCLILALLLVIK
jgi:hypothetical protein